MQTFDSKYNQYPHEWVNPPAELEMYWLLANLLAPLITCMELAALKIGYLKMMKAIVWTIHTISSEFLNLLPSLYKRGAKPNNQNRFLRVVIQICSCTMKGY
jgi:hypothetical protein